MKKFMLIGGVLCALLLTACAPAKNDSKENTKTMNTEQLENSFNLMNLAKEKVSLSDYKGKKVYVKFWASWCPICLGGLEDVQQLASEKHDFEVLTIVAPNANGEKNTKDFKEWFQGLHIDAVPVLFDEDGTYTTSLGVRGYPTSAFFNTNGELIKVQPGHMDNDKIIEMMNTLK